jgi:hypothetical protein
VRTFPLVREASGDTFRKRAKRPGAPRASLQYNHGIPINAPMAPLLHAADISFRLA